MRRSTSYLCWFSKWKITGSDLTVWRGSTYLGEIQNNFIFIIFLCILSPWFTLIISRVYMINYISIISYKRYKEIQDKYNKNNFWSCTNSNTPSQQGRYSLDMVVIIITNIWFFFYTSHMPRSSLYILKVAKIVSIHQEVSLKNMIHLVRR